MLHGFPAVPSSCEYCVSLWVFIRECSLHSTVFLQRSCSLCLLHYCYSDGLRSHLVEFCSGIIPAGMLPSTRRRGV